MNIKHVCLAGAAIAALSLGAAAAQADTQAQEDTTARQLDNKALNARAGAEWQPHTDINHSAEWISDKDAE
jgi:hypothetical protein